MEVRTPSTRRCGGFGLIDLMLGIFLISTLAAVAIPRYRVYQLKTKTAEVRTNLAGIRAAQESYYSEYGFFVAAAPEPAVIPGRRAARFDAMSTDFQTLGWQPEGDVYFSYGIATNADGSAYTADAGADIDANGVVQFWSFAKPAPDGTLVAPPVGCDLSAIARNDIAPCGSAAGQSVF